jgi:hypothetical protein
MVYVTEKEFTFGPSGTMGTDQTLVIDFIGDKKYASIYDIEVGFKVQLYDSQNKLQEIPDGTVKWAWYYNSDLKDDKDDKDQKLGFPRTIMEKGNSTWVTTTRFNINSLYIL